MHKQKYVVQQHIADELVISDHHCSWTLILDLITNVGLLPTITEVGPFYPWLIWEFIVNFSVDLMTLGFQIFKKFMFVEFASTSLRRFSIPFSKWLYLMIFFMVLPSIERLPLDLFRGTVHSQPTDGKLHSINLSIKYGSLHKIDIANWYPSSHVSTISITIVNLILLIGISSKVDVGDFVFQHAL